MLKYLSKTIFCITSFGWDWFFLTGFLDLEAAIHRRSKKTLIWEITQMELTLFLIIYKPSDCTFIIKKIRCKYIFVYFEKIFRAYFWRTPLGDCFWSLLLKDKLQKLKDLKYLSGFRSNRRRCFLKKGVLSNFAKCTGKNLCQSLFLNRVARLDLQLY